MHCPLTFQITKHYEYSVTSQKEDEYLILIEACVPSLSRKHNNAQLCRQLHFQSGSMVLLLSQREPERRVWQLPGILYQQQMSPWVSLYPPCTAMQRLRCSAKLGFVTELKRLLPSFVFAFSPCATLCLYVLYLRLYGVFFRYVSGDDSLSHWISAVK